MEMIIHKLLLVVTAVLLIIMFGCGGDSGFNPDPNSPSGQKINGDLTGHLYVSKEFEGWSIDLETGRATQAPQDGWYDYVENYNGMHGYQNHNGTGFLLVGIDCFRDLDIYLDCFMKLDASGKVIGEKMIIPMGLHDTKLSRDDNYIATIYADQSLDSPLATLMIYDSANQVVSFATMHDDGPGGNSESYDSGFEWLDNGQIIYAYKKSIYITGPYSAEGTPIITLPESSDPEGDLHPVPDEPRASPDGSKVAFRYVTGLGHYESYATIWIANIDGSDPHQLAHVPGSYQLFNYLDWSADGKYILVGEWDTASGSVTSSQENRLYAIPSDSRDIELDQFECNGDHGVICVRTYFESLDESLINSINLFSNVFEWIE
ncbi:MAG: hypothetical protein KZQ82_15515 [Candidatus Thiodiazotropha sp. (ex Lucinoma annulata)]|nr:hypothetical protein [Candidatus Thiodiazotropha sp. (ex Lucinoma annulata)]